ncbi:MAG: radical SAM protein [Deltaproteobacteria bacterium]|nr:radical SAM protein [Deltaproteobacteria bacterium]
MPLFRTSTTFGPVPSRRLGMSMGINNIPSKVCTYACIYCQVGRTTLMTKNRREFYRPDVIYQAAHKQLDKTFESGVRTDYLTFVPDGEPTLDINLGKTIDLLRPLGIPIAVITNSSLIWRMDVREELAKADWVSVKIDAVDSSVWRKINRPQAFLQSSQIQDGLVEFARHFSGRLVTETMLVGNLNENDDQLKDIAAFIEVLGPRKAYLSVPIRPPVEGWVKKPDENRLNRAYQIFSEKLAGVEYLIGYEGNAFAYTGNARKDILNITAVHPMRRSAVERLLSKTGEPWTLVDRLIASGNLKESMYEGHTYYLRTFGPS